MLLQAGGSMLLLLGCGVPEVLCTALTLPRHYLHARVHQHLARL